MYLLGPPRVRVGEAEHEPSPTLTAAVALYLAASDGWVSRDDICTVFWGDRPQAQARASLRQIVHRLRKEVYAKGIEADRSRLAWDVVTDLDARPERGIEPATFLEGFQLPHAPGFEDWLERQRAHILQERRSLAHAHARNAYDAGRAREAVDALAPWLAFDELDERTLQLYLTATSDAGLASEGMRRYEVFREALQAELGMDPAEHTKGLARELGRKQTSTDPEMPTQVVRVDRAAEPIRWPLEIIGRTTERERIERWMTIPGAIGIYGPGGIGKTRLASECFRHLRKSFPDNAWWIQLGTVTAAEEALAMIAQTLYLGSTATVEPIDLLVAHLADENALLVLDNLEQIDDAADLLEPLIDRCPNLRVLFTSRVRLELHRSRSIELGGLPVSDGDPSAARASTAAEMFIAAAQRHGREVNLDQDLPHIEAFCEAVAGMPLAVEHAAAWTRVMPVRPALDRWQDDPAVQPPFPTDVDPRHASMHRVFESSWRLLSAADRDALRRLQVFRDGCSLPAALDVAGVGIAGIARLRDHAMLDIDDAGRVRQHPLLTEWLGRSVAPDDDLMERHAHHYMSLLAKVEYEGQNVDPPAALRRITQDLANVEAAWVWALDNEAWDLFVKVGPMLGFAWLERRGSDRWAEQIGDATRRIPTDHPAWLRVEAHAAAMAGHAGDVRGWFERGRRARDKSRTSHDPYLIGWTSLLFSNAATALERGRDALEAKREALQAFRRTGQGGLIAMAVSDLYSLEPDRTARERWYRELESVCGTLQIPTLTAEAALLRAYGLVHDWGRYAEAFTLARSAVETQREAAWNVLDLAQSLVGEAHVLNYRGHLDAAEQSAQEALEHTADLDNSYYFKAHTASVETARARRLRGDARGAREALAVVHEDREEATSAMHYELAALALERGDVERAHAHADAASAALPKRPWARADFENTLEIQLLQASIAAHTGSEDAERLVRGVLARAWSKRLVPLTVHALAQLIPWLGEGEQSRVVRFLSDSAATPFETRLLLSRQGLADTTATAHATEPLDDTAPRVLEAALAEQVARFAQVG